MDAKEVLKRELCMYLRMASSDMRKLALWIRMNPTECHAYADNQMLLEIHIRWELIYLNMQSPVSSRAKSVVEGELGSIYFNSIFTISPSIYVVNLH
ncbi:hypothetical protein M5K25_014710 [Dendrobium thyrsiflorum]|uniref:Uncharacterized protein n=1 Tax=Dendrobium thyrsiflorum TaxID=117978 RepID=A0ABD0UVJ4_DENTH